jgi:acyl carrier protein
MNTQEKIEFLQTAIAKLFNTRVDLNLDDQLRDIGLDSLDVVELQLYYEEHFDVQLPDTAVINTVGDIVALM